MIPENPPNVSIHTTLPSVATNCCTHEIVPASFVCVYSDINEEITGLMSDNPNEIPNEIIIILPSDSLNQNDAKKNERKNKTITIKNFLS